jgi:hypothetical protein
MPSWKTFIDRPDASSIDVQSAMPPSFDAQAFDAHGINAKASPARSKNTKLQPPGT